MRHILKALIASLFITVAGSAWLLVLNRSADLKKVQVIQVAGPETLDKPTLADHLEVLDADTSVTLAAEALAFSDYYAVGLIAITAERAPALEPIEFLQSQPYAAGIFAAIYDARDATNVGRLYGLHGLLKSDCTGFARRATNLENPDAMVRTQTGCIVRNQSMSEVVAEMARTY